MTASERADANFQAIRIVRLLQERGGQATEAERRALALYTGWGDTQVRKYALDWAGRPTSALRDAMGLSEDAPTDGEAVPAIAAIRRSVLNAHYTDLPVVRAMWDILLHLGLADLKAPRILEPSVGVGGFLGCAPIDAADILPEHMTAVELDPLTAAVCRAIYPRCDVRTGSFQDVSAGLPPVFDVVVGNVPFGDYRVSDASGAVPEACQQQIHDYFVCRAVTMLRPGGVAVLITSKGTLDKESDTVRRWLSQRAELVGAFRLPSDAFRANAGTEVTTDVLILRRFATESVGINPEWLDTSPVTFTDNHGGERTATVNTYFVSHPEHVLGEWCADKLSRWHAAGVRRRSGDPTAAEMLRAVIGRLPAGVLQRAKATRERTPVAAGPATLASPQEMALGRVLRAVRRVVEQTDPVTATRARSMLSTVYDGYRAAYGTVRAAERDARHPLHRLVDERWWSLVASLEDSAGRKTGIFAGPVTVAPDQTAPRDAADALYQEIDAVGSFTLDAVAARLEAAGHSATVESVRDELRGAVFQMGPDGEWVTSHRYLAGDVVGKLETAHKWAALDEQYAENVAALAGVQPAKVPLVDIVVPFGASWVSREVYIAFLRHLFPAFDGYGVELKYVPETATWLFSVGNKYLLGSVENTRTYGTERMAAVDLIEAGLRLRLPTVYDESFDDAGNVTRTRNEKETSLAQAKLQEIRERWADWLPKDDVRAAYLESEYNRRFNRIVPRSYDGQRLTFPGMSLMYQGSPLVLHPHQRAGVLRIVERGEKDDTAMLAYYPGAGKTLCALGGAVKRLQLGLSKKVVIVVGKNVLHQWQETFRAVYPGIADWLLTGTDRAFDARNRRRFLLEAALGDARIVLVTYEQFRTIPLQPGTFSAYLRREVEDLSAALIDVEESDPARKNLERAFKARESALADFEAKYQAKWSKVQAAGDADVAWERWGCDLLIVDEFHSFKNDVVMTKMDGVSGLPRGESQRAFDMRVKLHYVTTPELFPGLRDDVEPGDEPRAGKAVALTGTPVTNSLAEVWIMLRHLQPRLLREMGLWHFDAWAGTFTTQVPNPEMNGVGAWQIRTRLQFHNLPELQDALGLVWDRVDPAAIVGKRPSIIGGRMRVVETEGSDALRAYTAQLAERADSVRKREVDPTEDNMLKITHDGRCASVFNGPPSAVWSDTVDCPACAGVAALVADADAAQLTSGAAPATCAVCAGRRQVKRRTKLDAVAEEVWDLYCHSDASQGCQLVFVDLFTPKAASTTDGTGAVQLTAAEDFAQRGVYGVLRDKMIALGMLAHEVAYIHDAASDVERRDLFARANSGEIRALIGSTPKMGLGVNIQRRAFAAHHVTVPWRPDWLDQANKRVDRDGNLYEAVHLVCYPTTGSYDVCLWQMIEQKGGFVSQVNSGTYAGRSADDIGDLVIDATTAKAVALGDLRVIEKVKLEIKLAQLQRQHRAWKAETRRAQWELTSIPDQLSEKVRELAELAAVKAHRDRNQLRGFSVKIRPALIADLAADPSLTWETVADRTVADQRVHVLADSLRHRLGSEGLLVGEYRGLVLLLGRDKDGVYMEARHGVDGHSFIVRGVAQRGGIGAFASLEAQLATIETQAHRIGVQRDILTKRLESLRAEAPAWAHAAVAEESLARYNELCAAVATAGIVDRQAFRFD